MGTHPIFESDFDCLTEFRLKIETYWVAIVLGGVIILVMSLRQKNDKSSSVTSSTRNVGIFHERQKRELCALHALNNVFQHKEFSKEELDEICLRLNPATVLNPHKSVLGTGNYDINVIMAALQSRQYQAVWHDKRKKVSTIDLARVSGMILNTMSSMQVGFVKLPIRRRHWVAVQAISGEYWNLDSKIKQPEKIGDHSTFKDYLKKILADKQTELFLVMTNDEAELQRYYKPTTTDSCSSTSEE